MANDTAKHDYRQCANEDPIGGRVRAFYANPKSETKTIPRNVHDVTSSPSGCVWPVGNVTLDESEQNCGPLDLDNMDLHSLMELRAQLETERARIPFELVVPGKIGTVEIPMLIDSGASVSVMSTKCWNKLETAHPERKLLPTDTKIRTASGEEVPAVGCLLANVDLAGAKYLHQFLVVNVAEDVILGLDFLARYNVDCDWQQGLLRLRGREVPSCREVCLGDGKLRRLATVEKTVLPANTHSMVQTKVKPRKNGTRGDRPDWGVTAPVRKPVVKHGVVAGRALVDGKADQVFIPIMNPTNTTVVLPRGTDLAFMAPVKYVEPVTQSSYEGPGNHYHSDFFESEVENEVTNTLNTIRLEEMKPEPCPENTPRAYLINVSPQEQGEHAGRKPFDDVLSGVIGSDQVGSNDPKQFYQKRDSDLSSDSAPEEQPTTPLPSETELAGMRKAQKLGIPEHLIQLFLDSIQELETEAEEERWAQFLVDYQDVFAASPLDLGRTGIVKHKIDTGNHAPIKQPPRRVPMHRREGVQDEIAKMLDRGVIEPCDGPWASPIVLVAKKGGELRFCVDFRELNEVTRKDAYPLPRIEDNLDCLQGAHWYSTLDLLSGFWQVEVAEEDRDKTAFTVGGQGLFRFVTMPFGLCNAPATFQRLMENVLAGLTWQVAVLYIDDIIVFSATFDEHLERLGQVLGRLASAGLTLKPTKCKLMRHKVEFLGHIVSADGVAADPAKIAKVAAWQTPKTLTQLRSFLGLCAYYRRFINHFSTIAKPFYKLMEKGTPFEFDALCEEAFQKLKKALTEAPILAYPRPDIPFILDTDASNVGIGAVLSQVQENEERVISYSSKTLNRHQRNYCVTRREMFAVVFHVDYYQHYLHGKRFLLRTDHAPLYWLLRKRCPPSQMARWIATLGLYDFTIEHRPGVKHGNADGLSRCMEGCSDIDELDIPSGTEITYAEMKAKASSTLPVRAVRTRAQAKREQLEAQQEADDMVAEFFGSFENPEPEVQPESQPLYPAVIPKTQTPSANLCGGDATNIFEPVSEVAPPNEGTESVHPKRPGLAKTLPKSVPQSALLDELADKERMEQYVRDVLPATWAPEAIAAIQQQDPDLKVVKQWLEGQAERPTSTQSLTLSATLKAWYLRYDQLYLCPDTGVLYIHWIDPKPHQPTRYRVLATPPMFPAIMAELHDAVTAGHLGQQKTVHRLKMSPFYWPGMVEYAMRWVRNCLKCNQRKDPKHRKRAPLQNYHAGATADRYACDLTGPFKPAASDKSQWIFTIADWYTRYMMAYPLQRATANAVAKCIVNFMCTFGFPLQIYSDNGTNVHGRVVKELCRLLGIQKLATVPYRPSSNGQIERQNKVIKFALANFVNRRASDWPLCLDPIMLAIRSSVHTATQETPNLLMMGREFRMSLDLYISPPPQQEHEIVPESEYAARLISAMHDAHIVVTKRLGRYYRYQKQQYDKNVKEIDYQIGQAVWLRIYPYDQDCPNAFKDHWDYTWVITKRIGPVHYIIQKSPYGDPKVVHADKIKPFYGEIPDLDTRRLWLSLQPNASRVDRLAVEPQYQVVSIPLPQQTSDLNARGPSVAYCRALQSRLDSTKSGNATNHQTPL